MNDARPHQSKFARYRARKKARGLRELRMWVPDLRNPEVQARLKRDAEMLRNSKAEKDALDFIEAVIADDPELYG